MDVNNTFESSSIWWTMFFQKNVIHCITVSMILLHGGKWDINYNGLEPVLNKIALQSNYKLVFNEF